mgnify:CR=1 FL=1
MEFEKVIKDRHSIRAFQPKKVEDEKIKKILELTNLSPSAGNLQAYEIFLVRDEGKKKALADAALGQEFIAEAPIVLVFCANPSRSASRYGSRGRDLYSIQDATIACSFAMLAATSLGLGSCWVGAFDEEEVKRVLGIKDLKPIAILPIGYPAEKPYVTGRRSLKDLVHEV